MVCSRTAATRRVFAPLAFLALATTGAGCLRAESPPALAMQTTAWDVRTMIDDSTIGSALDRFHYTGRWQSVTARDDGRSLGTSTRSYHAGDLASLSFDGVQVRLYGVVGPKGGDAFVSIDGRDAERVSFRAATVAPDTLVYTSAPLGASVHTLTLLVTGRDAASALGGFVNVDSAVVTKRPRHGA